MVKKAIKEQASNNKQERAKPKRMTEKERQEYREMVKAREIEKKRLHYLNKTLPKRKKKRGSRPPNGCRNVAVQTEAQHDE